MGSQLIRILLHCLWVAAVRCAATEWVCIPPEYSNGPLPPILPDSYYMAFELTDVIGKTKHADEVWYDWEGQRARIRSADQAGAVGEIVSFFSFGTAFRYTEKSGFADGDVDRVFKCEFFDLNAENKAPFLEKDGHPLRMVDVYQSLLFGGKYQYAFVSSTDFSDTRSIETNKFTTCITDRITGRRLNVTYNWTLDGKMPVRFEIDGGFLNGNGELESRVHQIASVTRFKRDPEMDPDMFAVPRDVHCRNDPRTATDQFPQLSPDFNWREEVLYNARGVNGLLLQDQSSIAHREVWSSQLFRLARMDWTPSARDGKTFEPFIGRAVSVIADLEFRALFIVQPATGECSIVPMSKDFTLVKEGEKGSFELQGPFDLLGLTEEHTRNGEYYERGSLVTVYKRFEGVDAPDGTVSIHEVSFRFDEELSNKTNKFYAFLPTTQLKRKLFTSAKEENRVFESTEQTSYYRVQADYAHLEKFEAPMCIAHHKKRFFRMGFATDFRDVIYGNGYEFLNRVRDMIARTGKFDTIMRVQKLEMYEDHSNHKILVKMVLLEPLPEIESDVSRTVDQARDAIVIALDGGQLAVPIEWQGTSNTIVPEPGSFVEYKQIQDAAPAHPKMLRRKTFSASIPVTSEYFSMVDMAIVCVCVFVVCVAAGFSATVLNRTWNRR